MNNSNYNSLAQQLMQSGLIKSEESEQNENNFFEVAFNDDVADSPIEVEIPKALQKETRRLNQSDLEMVSQKDEYLNNDSLKLIKRFIGFKQNLASKGAFGMLENLFLAFFPRLYKAKLVRDAMLKLKELNIDTKKLLDKAIPYGEGEMRYQSLIKYIKYANEIQTQIKKETN